MENREDVKQEGRVSMELGKEEGSGEKGRANGELSGLVFNSS